MKFDFNKTEYEYLLEQCGFTDEEKEILQLLRRGKIYKQIEDELHVCEKTVYNKVRSIKNKISKCIDQM